MRKPIGGRLLRKCRLRKKRVKSYTHRSCILSVSELASFFLGRDGFVDIAYKGNIYRNCKLESIVLSGSGTIEVPLEIR